MINKKFSLVIPAYNEASIIESTIKTLLPYLDRHFSDYELIISDDGSTDDTKAIAESIPDPHLRCVGHMPNKGKGAAVRDGMMAANGDIIAYTDADLAYGIDVIVPLLEKLEREGTDIVIGSRKLHPEGYENYPPLRLLASRCFSFLTGLLAGFQYDTQCGLKAFTAPAARQIFSRCETDGFAFDFELMMLAVRLGYTVGQLPVKIVNHRLSKVHVFKDSIKMFGDVIRIRRSVNKRLGEERGK
ncbi:MAG: glycosyltransferase [Clostridiales bacterium]|nr:glycosyltransferase [Clostridiales bacterium]